MVVMAGEVKPLPNWRRDTPKGCVVARVDGGGGGHGE
jgi:hypothetical protein